VSVWCYCYYRCSAHGGAVGLWDWGYRRSCRLIRLFRSVRLSGRCRRITVISDVGVRWSK